MVEVNDIAVVFFLAREAGEFWEQGMPRRQTGFLAVEDGRNLALAIVVKVDLPRIADGSGKLVSELTKMRQRRILIRKSTWFEFFAASPRVNARPDALRPAETNRDHSIDVAEFEEIIPIRTIFMLRRPSFGGTYLRRAESSA